MPNVQFIIYFVPNIIPSSISNTNAFDKSSGNLFKPASNGFVKNRFALGWEFIDADKEYTYKTIKLYLFIATLTLDF